MKEYHFITTGYEKIISFVPSDFFSLKDYLLRRLFAVMVKFFFHCYSSQMIVV